jgi:hypothetical protein
MWHGRSAGCVFERSEGSDSDNNEESPGGAGGLYDNGNDSDKPRAGKQPVAS